MGSQPESDTVNDNTVDSYNDEKGRVEETRDVQSISDVEDTPEEQALIRKIDRRILPIACLMYLFAYLDRSNLGNVRLQGLPQDTLHGDPTGKLFDWVNSTFFFSYILVQVPATVCSKFFPPRIWLGGAAIGWGICSTLMSSAFNFGGLVTARIGLGFFEAGFGPGIPLYLSFYYTRKELGVRMAHWFGFAAVAGAFGGLIAFGVQHANIAISNWRLLFIIEGVPSVLMGLIAITFLFDRPEYAKQLTESERELALRRMNRDATADVGPGIKRAHVGAAFRDYRVYLGGVVYFGLNCALASISAFLPTIIKTFGFTNAIAQLLTVPPYAVAAVVLTLSSYLSDGLQSRGLTMAGSSAVGGIGYLLLLTVQSNVHVRYFAVFCITSGTYTTIGLTIAWYAHNLGSETKKAAGIPLFMAIGQCGSVLGSHIYPSTEGPRYIKGFAISCALLFLASIISVVLSISYRLENARRDRLYGKPIQGEKIDTTELADQAPSFRYIP